MTREEATIQSLLGHIEAIEQEPCEDAVSRANLLKKFEDRFIELQKVHQADMQLGVNWCINTLKDMPPVTPTRIETVTEFADRCRECGRQKKGKWIKNSWEICYTCTRCWKTNPSGTKYPYCPNCGAEMESEDGILDKSTQ